MMRVLLDENIPRKLKWRFGEDVEIVTVPERGWNGMKNGELLRQAETEFDVMITMDRGLQYQQDLSGLRLGLVLLSAPSNQYEDLVPLMPKIYEVLERIRAGELIRVEV